MLTARALPSRSRDLSLSRQNGHGTGGSRRPPIPALDRRSGRIPALPYPPSRSRQYKPGGIKSRKNRLQQTPLHGINTLVLGPLRWPVLKCPPMAGFHVSTEVQAKRSFSLLILCPVEGLGAQLHHGGVQRQQFVFEAEPPLPLRQSLVLAACQHPVEQGLVQLPRPVSVGIGERCGFRAFPYPQMRSLPSVAAKPPQISRRLCACPNWQNSIATNCCQQVPPWRASPLCDPLPAASNSSRGNHRKI